MIDISSLVAMEEPLGYGEEMRLGDASAWNLHQRRSATENATGGTPHFSFGPKHEGPSQAEPRQHGASISSAAATLEVDMPAGEFARLVHEAGTAVDSKFLKHCYEYYRVLPAVASINFFRNSVLQHPDTKKDIELFQREKL